MPRTMKMPLTNMESMPNRHSGVKLPNFTKVSGLATMIWAFF